MKTITEDFLRERGACSDEYEWFCKNCLDLPMITQIEKLLDYKGSWASWLVTRTLSLDSLTKYAKFAARAAKSAIDTSASEYATGAAEYSARAAEYATRVTEWVAEYAAVAAADAAAVAIDACVADVGARTDVYKKIVGYGLDLLKEELKDENDN